MNIIIIMSDTLRFDHLGCYGNNWIRTPNLDTFARKCMVFDNAYQASFPTIPTRTDMFTGKYTFPFRGWTPLPEKETILSEELGKMGYVSMLICDTPHLVRDGHRFDRGFTAWDWIRGQEGDRSITDNVKVDLPCAPEKIRGPERMRDNHYKHRTVNWKTERDTFVARTMQRACDWLERNYTHEKFFLYIDTFDPHEPWDPPQHYVDMYDPGYTGEVIDHPVYNYCDYLTDDEIRHTRALYAGEVTLVDTWVGRLLNKIEALGLYNNTAIMFMADHGHYIGDHGRIGKSGSGTDGPWPFYQEVAHIPFFLYTPDGMSGRCDFLMQPVDVMTTALELGEASIPEGIKSQSLLPAMKGKSIGERPVAVTSAALNDNPDRGVCSSITDGEWTLHYRGAKHPAELYNIKEDPKEQKNLYAGNKAIAKKLHEAHLDLLKEVKTSQKRLEIRSQLPD
ncbi:sulfatase-like hydrolase/transferase [Candidatus Poribacteria bacterium]|nr:sulfatase-like hydrolase/transferase [Candidatus Poribacteria bacterium]